MVKGTPCSCRELGFGSHGAPQPSITLVPNDLILKKLFYWLIFCFYSQALVFSLPSCLHDGAILPRVTESLSTGN